MDSILNEIYDAYKSKIEEASSLYKSYYSCYPGDDKERDIEDQEDLKYFAELIEKIKREVHKI